ncbi:helix-turn-helix domain-containing protein [Chryseobacterium oryctis]|uniref:Helix-turn-helix domain-containing protein n=1 Tax=Chryseobacterium oryctis TaxID=2952618 RepID=A0ABT3HM21_9FLAO|nr:helix-turn-helix domain-containing protein [Chryseobacterium oryctis]MCW3160827.1 helix-turn-helix domain-containing protein [Chryseobacterium oryctis]
MNTIKNRPNYQKIYHDMIMKKFPDQMDNFKTLLGQENLSTLTILKINDKLFGMKNRESYLQNTKLASYTKSDILQMLDYQRKNQLNNTQLANHFGLSRNTVGKWKKRFLI